MIRPLSDDELAAQVADGRLKSTKGIGGTTFEVIAEAVAGDIPSYLVDVRERLDAPLTTDGKALRSLLKGDLHAHSEWSDGTTTIDAMADTARWLGHEYLVLSDHSPNLRVANGLTPRAAARPAQGDREAQRGGDRRLPHPDRHRGRHPRRRHARPGARAARPARHRGGERARQAQDAAPRDDGEDARRDPQSAHQRARPRHRPARRGIARHPAGVVVRREGGVRGVRGARRGRRDQLAARAAGPAGRAHRDGARRWMLLQHRQRRARARAALVPRLRRRARGSARRAGPSDRDDVVARATSGWAG